MRIGLVILPTDRWREARRQWEWADDVGFATAWTYDHIRWGGMPDGPWHASVPVLAAAAAVTKRVRLGTLVATPNFRHPVTLARDALAPRGLSRVNPGGTPWTALLLVAVVSVVLAATGTFERLLSLAITFILVTDGFMVVVLFRLRARQPAAPFQVPLYPVVPLLFLGTYVLLLVGALIQQSAITLAALAALALVSVVSWWVVDPASAPVQPTA